MDTSDPLLTFDESGTCCRCRDWETKWMKKVALENQYLEAVADIKGRRGARWDAVLGMSGGADSSWVYHLAKTAGLRVYPIHFDNGYDLPISTHNVKCLTEHWGDKVKVVKVDGPQFRVLQLAFLRSGTTGLEIPTDHAIKAVTYETARGLGVDVILNGTNIATESHGSPAWTGGHADWKYIKGIAWRFGSSSVDQVPHYSTWDRVTWMRGFRWVSLLDYVKYIRRDAVDEMARLYGYRDYGFKHMESRITRFLHGYIIPKRFGWDTRRSRLSAMICSGQMTREAALEMLRRPAYDVEEMEVDKLILCRNLGITEAEFEELMKVPLKHYGDYPNSLNDPLLKIGRVAKRLLG